ncbi:MAG: GNAT family N-acetyltransferase [Alphaproteobacteria bacterium]|nr:GNAT family N-acetyltransferase [Brevundimonas sp.]MBU3971358.1 GNAT family N-acetyltransferase [Alphaproteobacteria bacterium]MBU3974984.1 GNAT family N-acetyltransferase [Alphaproteobacteria bacterium]MBU4040652.1 GNAT family N-acetyltransferase [Alphaproteobacteria bacterium]MBU4136816.1 GNAT family N-acetyltransferase [Alphaproteobacteria bacterium]
MGSTVIEFRTGIAPLDRHRVWRWLSDDSYWARSIPWTLFDSACDGSLCFGLYDAERIVAFARVITDTATFAWLCDVYVDPGWRSRGLGKLLIDRVMADDRLQHLRRWGLATADAHGLYARHGFAPADASRHMEKVDRELYARLTSPGDCPG